MAAFSFGGFRPGRHTGVQSESFMHQLTLERVGRAFRTFDRPSNGAARFAAHRFWRSGFMPPEGPRGRAVGAQTAHSGQFTGGKRGAQRAVPIGGPWAPAKTQSGHGQLAWRGHPKAWQAGAPLPRWNWSTRLSRKKRTAKRGPDCGLS
jgi:hypothetical protein